MFATVCEGRDQYPWWLRAWAFAVVLVASWIVLGCAWAVLRSPVTVAGSGLLCRIGGQHWLPVEMGPWLCALFIVDPLVVVLGSLGVVLGTFFARCGARSCYLGSFCYDCVVICGGSWAYPMDFAS